MTIFILIIGIIFIIIIWKIFPWSIENEHKKSQSGCVFEKRGQVAERVI